MEMPIRPETISDLFLSDWIPEWIKRVNGYINTNVRFSSDGPWATIRVTDISTFTTALEKDLTSKIIEDIKPLYEKVGWEIFDEVQPDKSRYLTFTSNIWKDKSGE